VSSTDSGQLVLTRGFMAVLRDYLGDYAPPCTGKISSIAVAPSSRTGRIWWR